MKGSPSACIKGIVVPELFDPSCPAFPPCSCATSMLPKLLGQRCLHGEQHVPVQAPVQRGWDHVHR